MVALMVRHVAQARSIKIVVEDNSQTRIK